jgi:NADPH:quinone reductase-like Zn-dependent oxidoreductase
MKAIVFNQHGGPEVLQYIDVADPVPAPGEVLIDLKAAALNRLDLWMRNGIPGYDLPLPHISGGDGAGVVAALGEGVSGFAPGERVVINGTLFCGQCEVCRAGQENLCKQGGVLGEHRWGTLAEKIALPARNLLKMPQGFPFEEAAAASLVYLTAWHSLITRGGLQAGESVLIIGASGGVNSASIQIAKHKGAVVYVVGSSEAKLEQAKSLGADHLIHREQEDWGKAVFTLTEKRGVDVVVDNVGQATWATSLRSLRRGGRMLVVGNTSGYEIALNSRLIFGKHLSIIGSTMGTTADFKEVMGLLFAGRLKPVIGQALPLAETARAQAILERGEVFGKLVLRM